MNNKKILALTALALIAGACNSASPPQPIPTGMITQRQVLTQQNQKAISGAMNVPIARLDGTSFKLSDYKGKVLVVDFWATYCPPCVKQAPQLAELSKRYRDKGVEVIGLTSDEKTDQQKVEDFIKRVGINYNIGYASSWVSNAFLKGTEDDTGAPPIPQLFVLSRDGRVIEHMIGDSPQRGIEYLEKVVSSQLSGENSAAGPKSGD
ncbi:MAG: TlpA disulfide reductase family protein [Blastocatellales bacterium]